MQFSSIEYFYKISDIIKKMKYKIYNNRRFRHLASAPFIYAMIVPLFVFDISVEVYHRICFPLYGIRLVPRSEYILIDRHKLSYLSAFEKINCAYCGYANGLMAYSSEIAARTEKYWCGIKHSQQSDFNQPAHHKNFLPYGDVNSYKNIKNRLN